ncbi:MAG TPA: FAD-dependent oxidoreductase, partial [Pirellulales bacterium]|nr:FAD-dependent oxidoreductase [Pirellulales bacterium]
MTPSLHRRDVLRLSASAVAAPLFGSTLGAFEPQNRKADVVVIGAGVSGLAAARELTAKKLDCIVLEARNRIGGRVWSDRAWGATLDLGASWIHGIRGNPIYELAQQYSIQTFPTRSDAHWLYREGAHEYEDDEQEVTESRVKKLLADARAGRKNAIADGRPDVSLQEAIERVMGDRRYTPLQRQEIDFQISSLIEQEYAADSEELSNNYYDHGEDFPGSDVLFPQGYIQIVRRLAEGLTIKL